MRYLLFPISLTLFACSPNHDQVVKDVCIPLNDDESLSSEELATAKLQQLANNKDYDVEQSKQICREYLHEKLKNFSNEMRKSGLSKSGPYDAQ